MQYKEINVPSSKILGICEKVLPEIEAAYLVCEEIKKDRREKLQQFRTAESTKFERYIEMHGYEKSKEHEHYHQRMYVNVCKSYNEYYNPLEKLYNQVKSLIAGAKLAETIKMDQEQVDKLLALEDFDPKHTTQALIAEEPDLTSKFCDEDFVVPIEVENSKVSKGKGNVCEILPTIIIGVIVVVLVSLLITGVFK